MIIKEYTDEYKKIWNSFIDVAKNSLFMHKRDFMEYHADRFEDNSLMFFDDKDRLLALLPANKKDNILYSHGGLTFGGFITGQNMKQAKMLSCFDLLKMYMNKHKFKSLIYKTIPHIYHSLPAEEDSYALFKNNAKLLKVEPSSTIELTKLLKMPKGRKSQISKAQREEVKVTDSVDFETFIRLENAVLSSRHNTKAVHSAKELEYLYSKFPENIRLVAAMYNGQMIAGTLLFVYKDIVHTQYLASNEKGREIGALDLVISSLIEEYKNEKRYFDFGISTEDGGKFLNEGLISQKEGFGARTVCYNTWELSEVS